MTFKMTPAADGLSATLGIGSNAALKIDDAAKRITPVAPFSMPDLGLGQSLTKNGYAKLPGGLILQWDESVLMSIPASTVFNFSFDLATAFPNGFLSAQMSFSELNVIGPYPIYGISGTTTKVFGSVYSSTPIQCKVRMLAIGY